MDYKCSFSIVCLSYRCDVISFFIAARMMDAFLQGRRFWEKNGNIVLVPPSQPTSGTSSLTSKTSEQGCEFSLFFFLLNINVIYFILIKIECSTRVYKCLVLNIEQMEMTTLSLFFPLELATIFFYSFRNTIFCIYWVYINPILIFKNKVCRNFNSSIIMN